MPRNDKRLGRGISDIKSQDPCRQIAALTASEPRHHYVVDTNSASEALCAFLDGLRKTGTVFKGSNAQLIGLMVDALDSVSPNTDAASQDADTLARDFECIVEVLCDDDSDLAVYDHDEEEEDD